MKNLTKRKYRGIRQRHVNETVWNLYGYKFFQNQEALLNVVGMVTEDMESIFKDFDYVIPIKPRNSGSDITMKIAEVAATCTHAEIADILNPGNSTAKRVDYIKGMKVLIVDDVITSGRTARKAEKAIKILKPASIHFYALATAMDK